MPDVPNSTSEFFEALGLAIAQWSKVEDAFCDLFTRLTICSLTGKGMALDDKKRMPEGEGFFMLGNIFYSTTNFRARLELLTHMVTRLVSDETLRGRWNAVKNKALKLYARRNVLAHGGAWGGEGQLEFMKYSIFSLQDQKMTFPQMKQAAHSFFNFSERVTKLAIDVNAHLATRKRYPEDFPDEGRVN